MDTRIIRILKQQLVEIKRELAGIAEREHKLGELAYCRTALAVLRGEPEGDVS